MIAKIFLFLLWAQFAWALESPIPVGSPQPLLTRACAACHGDNGVSVQPLWPNLAGQKKEYLSLQLHNFKNGTRPNLLMGSFVQTLTDTDIEALAQYYSELKSL